MDRKFLGLCVLFLILGIVVIRIYSSYGVGWDFTAHYLGGKAILTSGFFDALRNARITNSTSVNFGIVATKDVYFEFYRAPLSMLAFAGFYPLLGHQSAIAYLVLMVVLLFIATLYVSDSFGMDSVLVGSLIVLPYIVIFPLIVNSEELLSLSLLIISIALLKKGKWEAGIFLGLACLSKYTLFIFIPLLLLNGGRKRIVYSYLAFALVTLPWIAFNYAAFGNPLYSYISSLRVSLESSPASSISLSALGAILAGFVPAIAIALAMYLKSMRSSAPHLIKGLKGLLNFRPGDTFQILLLFVLLSATEFVIFGFHEAYFDQARYGYPLFASVALLLAFLITSMAMRQNGIYRNLPTYLLCAFSIISMLAVFALVGSNYTSTMPGSTNPAFAASVAEIRGLNLSSCSFVSNDWVFLRYYNITAFSPFNYNSTISGYPSVVFYGLGPNSTAVRIHGGEANYSTKNFSIYVPANYTCK
ncbi:MAG: hypothetical protein KGH94_05355 [Candidatus Micrarchaeota archaeon]|nr:hypothetical protein [Candidatus Micrarchaeota archaeon]